MDDFTDETMLSADMGLYYDFTVDNNTSRVSGLGQDGSISCPGLVGKYPNGSDIPGLNKGGSPKYGDFHLQSVLFMSVSNIQIQCQKHSQCLCRISGVLMYNRLVSIFGKW